MSRLRLTAAVAAPLLLAGLAIAQPANDAPRVRPPDPARIEAEPVDAPARPTTWWEQWKAVKDDLETRYGTTVSLNIDLVGRGSIDGPRETWAAVSRYDLLVRQRLWDDALVSMDVRGGWGDGLDPRLGLFANTDQFAQTGSDAFILHLYFQQQLADDQLTLRVGKFDIGDWIDTNRFGFYNFLGYTFAHNGAIPLTGNTLGAMATYEPAGAEWLYLSGGFSNAGQTPYETGFSTAFDGQDEWLAIGELGVRTRLFDQPGIYRFIAWHNSRDWVTPDGTVDNAAVGAAISFDQNLTERLGVFLKFGVADGDPFEPKRFYAAGFVLEEPIPGRTNDSLALGVAVSEFTGARGRLVDDATDDETYIELYYNIHLTEWMQLQPVIQVVDNPGGRDRDTAVIVGAHLALRF